jgi:hypothetical protein
MAFRFLPPADAEDSRAAEFVKPAQVLDVTRVDSPRTDYSNHQP